MVDTSTMPPQTTVSDPPPAPAPERNFFARLFGNRSDNQTPAAPAAAPLISPHSGPIATISTPVTPPPIEPALPTVLEETPLMLTLQGFLNQIGGDDDGTPAPPQKRGLWRQIRETFAGEKLDKVKVEDHSKFVGWLGKAIAPLLLVSFSISTLNVLSSKQFADIGLMLIGKKTFDLTTVSIATTTGLFVIAMDVLMLACAILIRDMLFSKRRKTVSFWAGVAFLATIAGAIGSIEGVTFYVMLTGGETAAQLKDPLIHFLDVARSAFVPLVTMLLVVIPQRQLTREDIDNFILAKAASAMLYQLEKLTITGRASFAKLLQLIVHLSLPDNDAARTKQQARDSELDTIISSLQDDPRVKAMMMTVAQVEQQSRQAIAVLQRELEDARTLAQNAQIAVVQAAQNTQAEVMRNVTLWIVDSLKNREWSPEFVAAAPDMTARMDLESLLKIAGVKGAANGSSRRTSGGAPAVNIEGIFEDLGARWFGNTKEFKGVWVQSTDIPKLITGDKKPADPTKIGRDLAPRVNGDPRKIGKAYAVQLITLLKRYADLYTFDPRIIAWWNESQRVNDDTTIEADTEGSPTNND